MFKWEICASFSHKIESRFGLLRLISSCFCADGGVGQEFAKMTPVALLEETERAVGGAEMLSLHKRLVEAQGYPKKKKKRMYQR
jgi:hypothetical protein